MIYDWDDDVDGRSIAFNKRGMTIGGPVSITGRNQVASIDAGYWVAELMGIVAADPPRVKAYRALHARLEGGSHQIRVPVFDAQQSPWPLDVDGLPVMSATSTTFSDDTTFSDGTGFFEPVIIASVDGGTPPRSTMIAIDATNLSALTGGEYFSIGDRLYLIKEVLSVVGSVYTVAIWPPLREAVADNAAVNFDRPICRMRLVDEASGDLTLDWGRYGFPDMAFVEVF